MTPLLALALLLEMVRGYFLQSQVATLRHQVFQVAEVETTNANTISSLADSMKGLANSEEESVQAFSKAIEGHQGNLLEIVHLMDLSAKNTEHLRQRVDCLVARTQPQRAATFEDPAPCP